MSLCHLAVQRARTSVALHNLRSDVHTWENEVKDIQNARKVTREGLWRDINPAGVLLQAE